MSDGVITGDCGRKLFIAMAAFLLAALPLAAVRGAPPETKTGTVHGIRHVVLCWLVQPGDATQAQKLIDTSLELGAIPGVDAIVAGTALPSDRAIVDDSFDVGVVMEFRDAAALNAYLGHPEHLRRVKNVLEPLCGRVQVYDIRF